MLRVKFLFTSVFLREVVLDSTTPLSRPFLTVSPTDATRIHIINISFYLSTSLYVHGYMHMHVHVCICMYVYIYMYIYTYICMYLCMYVGMYVCMYVCMCLYIYTYIHTYIYTPTRLCAFEKKHNSLNLNHKGPA